MRTVAADGLARRLICRLKATLLCERQSAADRRSDEISRLELEGVKVYNISLLCSSSELRARPEGDVSAGIRQADVIERSLSYLPLYGALDTAKINTGGKTAAQTARETADMVNV